MSQNYNNYNNGGKPKRNYNNEENSSYQVNNYQQQPRQSYGGGSGYDQRDHQQNGYQQ
jgi:hypothetical protein